MSIQSEISRISGKVRDALAAVAAKGITVPDGAGVNELPGLIGSIVTGGGGGSSGGQTGVTAVTASYAIIPVYTPDSVSVTAPWTVTATSAAGELAE